MAFIHRNLKNFFVSFIFSFSIFLLFPLSIYAQNIDITQYSFKDILLPLILFTLIGFILTSLFVVLFSKRLKYIPLLFTTLLVCLWIQGNLIKYNLGSLDGHLINWSVFYRRIWIEILIWVAVFIIFIVFRKKLLRNNNSILIILLFLFTLPSVFVLITNKHHIADNSYLDYSGEFNYSQKNVIIIILDSFKSDTFKSILKEYPEYQETFKDFVFYEDALGGYPTTRLSVPLILTGENYQNLVPVKDYLSSVEKLTISYQLKKHGYEIESYPYVPFFSSIYDNQANKMPFEEQFSLSAQQILISGIRYSPLILKPLFIARYYHGINYVHKDLVAFDARVNEVKVTINKPLFKLIHLSGTHFPYQLDSSLNRIDAGPLEQAAGSLLPVRDLLNELKNAKIYDNSLILIMGDHGNFDPDNISIFPLSDYAQPLLMAKKIGQQFEKIQISDSPVTLGDVPKTIANETGIDTSYQGYSIFDKIPENRIRNFYYYTWNQEYWSTKYMPIMDEFEIMGPARLTTSWKYIGQYIDGQYLGPNDFENSKTYKTLMGR